MSCSNCYNGCTEISTDRCIRYTGLDVPVLGIKNGDSLSFVEQALIEFLTATLDGSGIVITLPPNTLCQTVSANLPTCGELTASVLFEALINSICQVDVKVEANTILIQQFYNGYIPNCIPNITNGSSIKVVVQALIDTLCTVSTDLNALELNVQNNYVRLDDLDVLIAAYLSGGTASTRYSARMVPFAAVPYFGALSGFDANGVGIIGTPWEKIYICNGYNGLTPDMRGRVPVGVNNGSGGGGTLSPTVAPIPPNPSFSLGTTEGYYNVFLSASQMPSHNHVATATSIVTPSSHTHTYIATAGNGLADGAVSSHPIGPLNASATTSSVTIDVATNVSISPNGGGASHINYQPSIGCYYIMYIP